MKTEYAISLSLCSLLLLLPIQISAQVAQTALESSTEYERDVENYANQIGELESELGPYDIALLEPLDSMVALHLEAENYSEVNVLLERKLQILRTTGGLQNPDLIPIVRAIVTNKLRLGLWREISDELEHIRFLTTVNNQQEGAELFSAMAGQAEWYLTRVYLEDSDRIARNFFEAWEIYEDIGDQAREFFGEDNPLASPWLYQEALANYRLAGLLNSQGRVASDTYTYARRVDGVSRLNDLPPARFNISGANSLFFDNDIPIVDRNNRDTIGEPYIDDSLRIINSIVETAENAGEVELAAMARIYEADYKLILGKGGAIGEYRRAIEALLEAGISQEKIDQFFSMPVLIPAPAFFESLDQEIAFRNEQRLASMPENASNTGTHLGTFTAWHEQIASVAKPKLSDQLWDVELPYATAELELTVNSRGSVSSAKVIEANPDKGRNRSKIRRAVRELKFRPTIIEGKAKRTRDLQLRYHFLEE